MLYRWVAVIVVVATLLAAAAAARANGTVTITPESSTPVTLEIKAGAGVSWLNATGATAHVDFGNGVRFDLGKDAKTRFETPGTYAYTVHVSGTKTRAHTGAIVVK